MLSSHARLRARESSKEGALPRQGYLAKLVAECAHESTSREDKLQCLAHLANFAYDPINYVHLLRLNVVDLFVDVLDEALQSNGSDDVEFQRVSMQGICNLAADTRFQKVLVDSDIVPLLLTACNTSDITTIASALATLFFMLDAPCTIALPDLIINNTKVHECIQICTQHASPIVRNTATSFLYHKAKVLEESTE